MRKVVSSKQILASTALAASLSIFGCTTNKMPGDGQPTSMPYHSPATSAPTNGTSGGVRPGTYGMISSGPASMTTPSVDAFAQVADQQGFRGRILGPSFPGQSDIAASIQPTGQFQNPSLVANPQVTVNRSISSDATPAIINDSGTGITFVSGGGTTAAATVAPTTAITAPATVAGTTVTNGSIVTGAIATAPVTTLSAATASPSQVVIGTPTPTQSSIGVPSPTVAANPATVIQPSSGTTTTTTSTAITSPSTTQSRAIGNLTVPSAASLPSMISSSGSGNNIAITSPSTVAPVTTTTTPSRTRAVRTTSATSQPATVTTSRTRAVRLTTSSNGTPMITNVK